MFKALEDCRGAPPPFTMRDLAGVWQLPLSTAYQYGTNVVRAYPDFERYRRGRCGRRFNLKQADRMIEAVWGIASA